MVSEPSLLGGTRLMVWSSLLATDHPDGNVIVSPALETVFPPPLDGVAFGDGLGVAVGEPVGVAAGLGEVAGVGLGRMPDVFVGVLVLLTPTTAITIPHPDRITMSPMITPTISTHGVRCTGCWGPPADGG